MNHTQRFHRRSLRLRPAGRAACWVILGLCATSDAQTSVPFQEIARVTWREEDGGNRNDYVLVAGLDESGDPSQVSFFDALDIADSLGGWVLTVQSAEENSFVANSLRDFRPGGGGDFWLGFSDSEEFGGFESVFSDPNGPEGWVWVNGDEVTYTNWAPGEPNNAVNGQGFDEDFAELWDLNGDQDWNDIFTDGDNSTNWAVVELPFTPPPLTLQIDPHSGYARVFATVETAQTTTLTSYTVRSSDVVLDDAGWEETNLASRGVDAQDPSRPGESWEVVFGDSGTLFEAYLLGGTPIEKGESVNLGKVVPAGTTEADGEVVFDFSADLDFADPEANSQRGRQFFDAEIEYKSPIAGDYNWDGVVDAGDYTVFRDTLGSTTQLIADGNRDGVVNQDDYVLWRNNYGASETGLLAASSAATPEPSSFSAMAVLSLVYLANRGCRS